MRQKARDWEVRLPLRIFEFSVILQLTLLPFRSLPYSQSPADVLLPILYCPRTFPYHSWSDLFDTATSRLLLFPLPFDPHRSAYQTRAAPSRNHVYSSTRVVLLPLRVVRSYSFASLDKIALRSTETTRGVRRNVSALSCSS